LDFDTTMTEQPLRFRSVFNTFGDYRQR